MHIPCYSMEPIHFWHMEVRPATLEYASAVLTQYFSTKEPTLVTLPSRWGEEALIRYISLQFKSLRQEGMPIDQERLNKLIPLDWRFQLSTIEIPPAVSTSQVIVAYISVMGQVERPFEVAILFTLGDTVLWTYHKFLSVRKITAEELKQIKHVHGLKQRSHDYTTRETFKGDMLDLLTHFNPDRIWTDNADVASLLPIYEDRLH